MTVICLALFMLRVKIVYKKEDLAFIGAWVQDVRTSSLGLNGLQASGVAG